MSDSDETTRGRHPSAADHRTRPFQTKRCRLHNHQHYLHPRSASTPANDRVAAATFFNASATSLKRGPTVAHWSMFGDQQPKRKGISKEPGEAKLLDAVAMLTLNLGSERRTTTRDQNTVFKIRKDSELACPLQEGIVPSMDKMIQMLQRTRENSFKGFHNGSDLMHYYDCSCGAWHS